MFNVYPIIYLAQNFTTFLSTLPVTVAPSASDDIVIRYVLPVL